MTAQTVIPEVKISDAELVTFARARIAADVHEMIANGVRAGIFHEGNQVRLALDVENGITLLGDPETQSVYALAPATSIIGEDAEGNTVEHEC